MSEVSCRMMVGLFQALDGRGISVEPMLEGSGYTRRDLSRVDVRIPWNDFAAMAGRLEMHVGRETLVGLGSDMVDIPIFEGVWRVLGLMVHPRHMVWASTKGLGNQMFTVIRSTYTKLSPDHVQLDLRIAEGFEDCPAYFWLSQGVMARGPALLGRGSAEIELVLGPNCATYDMRFPPGPKAGRRKRLALFARAALALRESVPMAFGREQELVDALLELRRAKDDLARSEARARAVIDSVPDYIITLDAELRIASINRADYGLTADQLVGTPIVAWYDESERAATEALFREVLSDGHLRSLQTVWTSPDGQARHFSQIVAPIREKGRAVGLVIAARENTAELRAEEERRGLERHLARQERIDSLGLLAGGVAHDFNNLLTVIVGSAEFAQRAVGRGDDGRLGLALGRIREASDRAIEITRQMLSYAGHSRGTVVPADLSAKVEGISHLIRNRLPPGIDLRVELASGLPLIDADLGALDQVVLNLLGNAVDAIGERSGTITVRTRHLEARPPPSVDELLIGSWPSGEAVVLEVRDDGVGMDRAVMERIFDPFYSSKPEGHGLGLASVQGIVKSHGAAVCLRSTQGAGTSFTVAFPVGQRRSEEVAEVLSPFEHTGRILVVDDNEMVCDVAVEILRRAGYEAAVASSGEEALERFDEDGAFRAVLLDLSMPGLGGAETCRRLKSRDPSAVVLITSGHDRQGEGASLVAEGLGAAFVQKPWTARELLPVLQSALRGGEPG